MHRSRIGVVLIDHSEGHDDVRAELARLIRHGARVVEDHGEHAVLKDPAALVFCVVPVQTGQLFEAEATTWD